VIATTKPDNDRVAKWLESEGVTVNTTSSSTGLRMWAALLQLVGRKKFDVLHSHVHRANYRGAILSMLAGIPVFIATEHSWSYRGRLRRRLRDRYLIAPRSSAFVCISEADRLALATVERIPASRLHMIPNGVSLGHEYPVAFDEQGFHRLSEIRRTAKPLIGTVCYLRRQKALHDLIDATVILRRQVPTAELAIVGKGPLEYELRQIVASREAEEYIHFVGHSDTPRKLLPAFDIFAMSSNFEGMPFALLDAMAERKTIVATSVGSIPDLVPHRVASLLVAPGAPRKLAAALRQVSEDTDLAERLANEAERRVRPYTLDASVSRWFTLYDSLWPG
jgi:glycosyltransferase involved in cell wall biosynthesis